MFGNPESVEYKFDHTFNMGEKTRRFYKLKDETANLKKHVNMKIDTMADQSEREYTDLIKKRDLILADKDRIERTISELDALRNSALM
jgi:structural maintenance of chromosome 2